jgi:Flp pilus assembly protein TadG
MSHGKDRPVIAAVLQRLRHRDEGIAAVEFAFTLPVLIALCLGGFEVSSYAMLNIKLQHAANAMAELATMDEQLPATTLDGMFAAVTQIVAPFPFGNRGTAIVTGVGATAAGAPPVVNWQRVGAGTLTAISTVGAPGGAATVPNDLPVTPLDSLVVAEVVYDYRPILLGFVSATMLRKIAYYRPRFGTLPSLS